MQVGTLEIETFDCGQFVYFGLVNNLLKCKHFFDVHKFDTIILDINVDGVPVYRSGKKSFWPILCNIGHSIKQSRSTNSCIFLVGLYLGKIKPPINSFLREFVQELNELLEIGISIDDKKYDVKLRSIIADAPARSFVKQTRGHGAYFGCDRCEVKGHYSKGSMSYDVLNAPKRTHLSFVNQRQAIYHKGVSPLTDVKYINMIEDFPLDYMHCILLGVVKRLLVTWISKVPYKLPVSQKKSVDSVILGKVRKFIPKEFNRLPRSLDEASDFKATEYRTLLLYTGCIIFKDVLPIKQFQYFLLLMFACRIFCSPISVKENDLIEYGEKLVIHFVNQYKKIYNANIVYNIHSLIHVGDDVRKYGHLDRISAFPFETMNGRLKKQVRSGNLPLEQVVNRVKEGAFQYMSSSFEKKLDSDSRFFVNDCMIIPGQKKNSCVKLRTGDIGIVIKKERDEILMEVFSKKTSFLQYPCDSSLVGAYIVYGRLREISVHKDLIESKCLMFPYNSKYIVITIL